MILNHNGISRKDAVLKLLTENLNAWIEGPVIASAEVGGSEGLKRLRELRDEGHNIEAKRHPDKNRDIWLYRLSSEPPKVIEVWECSKCAERSSDIPDSVKLGSIASNMVQYGCSKCRKNTIWQLVKRS